MKHDQKQHNQRGFTLLELLLYISIIGSLLTAVVLFFASTLEARIKAQTISEVNQQGVAAMEYMTGMIREATSITSPLTTDGGVASLNIAMPLAGQNPTIINLSSATLQTQEGASAAVALTNNLVQVSNLTFKNLSRSGTPGVIQVSFTLSRINPAGRNEYDYQKTFTSTAALRWP